MTRERYKARSRPTRATSSPVRRPKAPRKWRFRRASTTCIRRRLRWASKQSRYLNFSRKWVTGRRIARSISAPAPRRATSRRHRKTTSPLGRTDSAHGRRPHLRQRHPRQRPSNWQGLRRATLSGLLKQLVTKLAEFAGKWFKHGRPLAGVEVFRIDEDRARILQSLRGGQSSHEPA